MAKLEDVIRRGTTASKPAATAVATGTLYYDTTLDKLQRSSGSAWEDVERADGGVTFVGARVYHSATQAIANNTETALAFDSEQFDTDAFHDTVTNNSRLTIPAGKAGKYLVGGAVNWSTNSLGTTAYASIRKNGTGDYLVVGGSRENAYKDIAPTLVDLAVADYIQLIVIQTSGASVNITRGADFSPIFWLQKVG